MTSGRLAPQERSSAPAGKPDDRPSVDGSVRIHRDSKATELSEALDARSFTHGGEIYLPARHGPLDSPAASSLLAHEMTHVAQQRRLGSSLPGEGSGHGQELESHAVAAERAPELTLAMPGQKAAAGLASDASPATTSQRQPATAADHHEAATLEFSSGVQRAPSATPNASTGTGSTDLGPTPRSDKELEELAGQLYSRIGHRIRRELLVDRERAGLMMDLS